MTAEGTSAGREETVCPESTIDSATRRNFIKKAALATAAVGIGSSVLSGRLGKSIVPESSASSAAYNECNWYVKCHVGIGTCTNASCVALCVKALGGNIHASGSIVSCYDIKADKGNSNDGSSQHPGLVFGCSGNAGISSALASGSPNLNGLDFYTCSTKRMSITKCGKVGIGSLEASGSLCVTGTVVSTGIGCLGPVIHGINGAICGGTGVRGYGFVGVCGCSSVACGSGVYGNSTGKCGTGVSGHSSSETGAGVCGAATVPGGVGIRGCTRYLTLCAIPIVARGASCQSANLQQWRKGCCIKSVVSSCGWFGIGTGTTTPSAPLDVRGSKPLVGMIKSSATSGDRSSLVQFANGDCTPVEWNTGVAGKCNSHVPDGNFYIQHCSSATPALSLNKCGWIGIGTSTPSTPLDVVGAATVDGSLTALAGATGTVPIVAKGASGQTAHLQEWRKSCCTAVAVLTKGGALGIGNNAPVTSLTVNGSVSYRVTPQKTCYTMEPFDFAVLGSTSSTAGITITLPPAKTAAGMIVFIKKVDSNPHAVTVAGSGTDMIETNASVALNKQFDSLQLISNGTSMWYILGSSKCGGFVS